MVGGTHCSGLSGNCNGWEMTNGINHDNRGKQRNEGYIFICVEYVESYSVRWICCYYVRFGGVHTCFISLSFTSFGGLAGYCADQKVPLS